MLAATIHGSGRPVVLLPGFGLDAGFMAECFEPAFARTLGWRRIYLDLPGTGESPPGEPTSEAVLLEVRSAATHLLGPRVPFRLVGHSYGGYLAAAFARRWPERVAGLLLVCCGPRIAPRDRDLAGVLPPAPEPHWLDAVPHDLHEHLTAAVGLQTREVAARVAAALGRRGPVDDAYLAALRPAGYRLADEPGRQDAEHRSLEVPVCLLAGRRDRIAGFQDALGLLGAYPRADGTVVADVGHYLPLERPDILVALTLDWLARPAPTLP